MNLKHLTDQQLLKDTKTLSQEDKKLTIKLLHHIHEIDRRKLYSDLGYSSLFKYVVEELSYSEGSAIRRINAAKLLISNPEIENKIESGELTVSNLSKLSDKIRDHKITDRKFQKDLLTTIENTTARQCDKILSEIITSGSIPTEPVKHLHFLNITVSDSTFEKFEEIRGLLAHKRLTREEIFDHIFEIALVQLREKRFHLKSKVKLTSSEKRYIGRSLKKVLFMRDKKCTKCGSTFALQVDHIKPFALGGKTDINNLRLLCRSCNQRERISANLHIP